MKRKYSESSQGTYTKKSKQFTKPSLKRQSASIDLAPELKYNDAAISADASTTEQVVALSSFAAGDTALTRDGNKIMAKSLALRVNLANEALTQNNTVRFVVVCDHTANTVAPTWFTGAATDVMDQLSVNARRSVASASKYTVLMDKVVVLNQGSGTGGALQQAYFKKYIKIPKNCQLITYQNNTSAIPMTNALSLLYIGTTASGATDADVVGTTRLRFVG